MDPITVEVTESDIQLGQPDRTDSCPVALAIRRQFSDRSICVMYRTAIIGENRYNVDDETVEFIHSYDRLGMNAPSIENFRNRFQPFVAVLYPIDTEAS